MVQSDTLRRRLRPRAVPLPAPHPQAAAPAWFCRTAGRCWSLSCWTSCRRSTAASSRSTCCSACAGRWAGCRAARPSWTRSRWAAAGCCGLLGVARNMRVLAAPGRDRPPARAQVLAKLNSLQRAIATRGNVQQLLQLKAAAAAGCREALVQQSTLLVWLAKVTCAALAPAAARCVPRAARTHSLRGRGQRSRPAQLALMDRSPWRRPSHALWRPLWRTGTALCWRPSKRCSCSGKPRCT
jgi:hypothetical protein